MDDKLKETIKKLIENKTKGADKYVHNGSTWLIFSDEKKWVIELTKERTLWYNYYFFKRVFDYFKLDVVENQHIITEWVEYTIINPVKQSRSNQMDEPLRVKDTIQNGVKSTKGEYYKEIQKVEYTIENGVKYTNYELNGQQYVIEDTIQNGVKYTISMPDEKKLMIEDTIQNGVKYTGDKQGNYNLVVEDTIQNGIKHTEIGWHQDNNVDDTIENGVKKTYSDKIPHEYDWTKQFTEEIDDIIKNGVKETKEEPSQRTWMSQQVIGNGVKETKTPGDGDIESTIKWMKENKTDSVPDMIDDIIENGIRKTQSGMLFDESKIDTVISEGVKETYDDVMPHTGRVEGVIKNGVKKTVDALSSRLPNPVGDVIKNGVKVCVPSHTLLYNPMDFSVIYHENHRLDDVASVLEKGIKEVQPLPSQEGNKDWGNYYHRQEDRTKPHTEYVNDVVRDGVKETVTGSDKTLLVDDVLSKGKKI